MKIKYKSKTGMCLCTPPKQLIHTIENNDGSTNTFTYGEAPGDICKYCGKPWNEH